MSEITMPDRSGETRWHDDIESISDLIDNIETWHDRRNVSREGRSASRIWFRGHSKTYSGPLRPKVHRDDFIARAGHIFAALPDAQPPLILERHLLKEFRMAGAHHFDAKTLAKSISRRSISGCLLDCLIGRRTPSSAYSLR
jgi:hypothetical protein